MDIKTDGSVKTLKFEFYQDRYPIFAKSLREAMIGLKDEKTGKIHHFNMRNDENT